MTNKNEMSWRDISEVNEVLVMQAGGPGFRSSAPTLKQAQFQVPATLVQGPQGQEDLWGVLASQSSQIREHQVQ